MASRGRSARGLEAGAGDRLGLLGRSYDLGEQEAVAGLLLAEGYWNRR